MYRAAHFRHIGAILRGWRLFRDDKRQEDVNNITLLDKARRRLFSVARRYTMA